MANPLVHQIIVDTVYDPDAYDPYDPDTYDPIDDANNTADAILHNFAENGILVLTAKELSDIIARAVIEEE